MVGKVDYSSIKSSIGNDLLKLTNNFPGAIIEVGTTIYTISDATRLLSTPRNLVQDPFFGNQRASTWTIGDNDYVKVEQILIKEVNIAIEVSWP